MKPRIRRVDHLLKRGRRIQRAFARTSALLAAGKYGELFDAVGQRLKPKPPPARFTLPLLSPRGLALAAFLETEVTLSFARPERPKVSVLLVVRDGADEAYFCLRSLLEQGSNLAFDVVLVDDAADAHGKALLARIHGATVLHNAERRGVTASWNQAAAASRGDSLLFLDTAATLLPGALDAAVHALESAISIAAVGGSVVGPDGRLLEAGGVTWSDGTCEQYGVDANPEATEYRFRRDVDYCSRALLVRRTAFEVLAGFDEAYGEGRYVFADLCVRLRENRLRVVFDPKTRVLYPGDAPDTEQDPIRFRTERANYLATRMANSPGALLEARYAARKPRLLFIEDRVPHPALGTGYPRSAEMLRIVSGLDYDVTLLPTTVPDESWASIRSLVAPEVEVVRGVTGPLLGEFLSTRVGYYDVILVARPHNMAPLKKAMSDNPEWFRGVHVVYDAEALFCLRTQVFQQLKGDPWPEDRVEKEIAAEVALTDHAQVVLSVSPFERGQFERYGVKDARLLIHTTSSTPTTTPFSARRNLLFVGAMPYHPSPNTDSILWFVNEVFPHVRAALGDVRLLVAGVNDTREVMALESDSVRMLGVVPELTPLFEQARIFVAPTRYAAGVPLKVCEAAARGLPCVTSTLIASQLGWKDGDALLFAPTDDPLRFAAQCVALYSNEEIWTNVRRNALALVSELCSERAFAATLESALAARP